MLVTRWASILVTIMIQLQSAYADLGRKVISRLPNQLVLPDQTEPMAMHYFFEQPEQDNGPSKLKWTNEEVGYVNCFSRNQMHYIPSLNVVILLS
jgi:hypothetical protein